MPKPDLRVIYDMLEPVIEAEGMELYDLEFLTEYGRRILRIYIDKEQGHISLDDCEKINYAVEPVLDADDFIPFAYVLEVSSPGVERKLVKDRHYYANMGKLAEVRTVKPPFTEGSYKNNKKFRGVLTDVDTEFLVIKDNGYDLRFERKNVAYCRLIYTED